MTTKERAIRVLQELPEDATLGEIVEELRNRVSEDADAPGTGGGAWDLLRASAGALEMPADWASEHDHYLHGTPKRSTTT